ncbi:MAG: dihydropteroate synthase [Candidatus Acidiferrales bacterium]
MAERKRFRLRLASRTLVLGERTIIMGVLNVTPDSFSDGGQFLDAQSAVMRGLELQRAGADLLDIGGESTRPGALSVHTQEELDRIMPVLEGLRGQLKIPISVDTQKSEVADAALRAGAEILNDVSALRTDLRLAEVARRHRAPVVLMHMRGTPANMQEGPFARDVVRDVIGGLRQAVARARKAGLPKSQIMLDPGFGFGKSYLQNYELLGRLAEIAALGFPVVAGTSRKSFIGRALAGGKEPWPIEERLWGTAATVTAAILGGAHIVRVHDVAEMVQVARVADAVRACER